MRQIFCAIVLVVLTTAGAFSQLNPDAARKTGSEQSESPSAATDRTASLTHFTVEESPQQVRVVVESDIPVRYHAGSLRDPDRIYLDLEGARPAPGLQRRKTFASEANVVRRIRVGIHEPGVTRVVLDLAHPVAYSISTSAAAGRIVVILESGPTPARAAGKPSMIPIRAKDSDAAHRAYAAANTAEAAAAVPKPELPPSPATGLPSGKVTVPPNSSAAFHSYFLAAQRGSAAAQFALGDIYFEGRGVPKNPSEAGKWYLRAAEQGHAGAQTRLGFLYLHGMGVKKDDAEAVKWFRQAAARGDVAGENNLGAAYLHGRGVAVDYAEAAKWLRAAAEHGLAEAQYALGTLYANGRGVPRDNSAARGWLQRSAQQGFAPAQLALGQMYLMAGKTSPQSGAVSGDSGDAAVWIERAAQRGLPEAQLALARMFRDGVGVRRSGADSAKWFREAALQGSGEAQYALGEMYRDAHAVPRDPVLAYAWFAVAGASGDQRGLTAMNSIAPTMTMAQIVDAQRQARSLAVQVGSHGTSAAAKSHEP